MAWRDEPRYQVVCEVERIADAVSVGNYRPTDQALAVFGEISKDIDEVVRRMRVLNAGEIASFSKQVAESGVPTVFI